MNSRHLVLIGFMGVGKTTVASLCGKRLSLLVKDVDQAFEERWGMSIAEGFQQYGEKFFRRQESMILEQLLAYPEPLVIATGGGTPMLPQNQQILQEKGWLVHLTAPVEVILNRVMPDGKRPLLENKSLREVKALYREREKAYAIADVTVDTATLHPEEVAEMIVKLWLYR